MSSREFFATHPVFTHDEYLSARQIVEERSPRTADSLLRQHLQNGQIVRIRRGLYASVPLGIRAKDLRVDPYLLATKLAGDATVAYHAALQFHGRSYSLWSQLYFLSSKDIRPFSFGGTSFIRIKPKRAVANQSAMGGEISLEMHAGSNARITSIERAMVDVMSVPELGGGWEEIWRSLEMVEFFNLDALIAYALTLSSALTIARVGFFLEQHRESLFVEDRHLHALEKHRPRQKRYFDSSRSSGRLISRWNVVVPEQVLNRSWEEVL
ncbi:transcriptional regulator [Myxococcota bacterium]|nr:transcriptional regulator [Myxococcota bacterium]